MKVISATTPNYKVTRETATVVKNIVLEGVETLKAEKITTTYEVKREVNPKTDKPISVVYKKPVDEFVEPMSFDLTEVMPEKLAEYREDGISSFVLKYDGKFYYTVIPDNISFVSSTILGNHQCAVAGHECHRLSTASDEEGGCAKVRNRSKCIERYPWITSGYETFNTKHDSFVVTNCLHYEECPPRKTRSVADTNKAKLGLAMFVWDDVTSREEVKRRIEANHKKNGFRY